MRKTLDQLISWTGILLATVLLVAGGLLTWASSFVESNVHDQLAAQDITMPEGDAIAEADKPYLEQYAGQQLATGDQAKAYADHYILVHMNAASDGRTYQEVSGEFMAAAANPDADPDEVAALGELRQTLFMGNTLRGLLLYGYAFATMGVIAGYAAIAAFVAAGVFLILGILGLRHAKRVDDAEAPVLTRQTASSGV
jgi:hypothetical protein